ncbi:putative DNA mismatch repair protein [Mitosporidium daphniae]|uniref:Putative DNA mismatch repair protein n=1 Tax=Mitosporidium daphniae TaxID=1485682 RepID=A0A098VQH5_9MICR|nr:putative DNA mismatch repair protein [Mitosporidium daphniae]KGG51287.1 putative DNA mismatch repair protein [Mitosporidium daphniae]|eukprot:XP_013237714.1 putative DNA mismatch repair protein [Mitosporidium daphniae]
MFTSTLSSPFKLLFLLNQLLQKLRYPVPSVITSAHSIKNRCYDFFLVIDQIGLNVSKSDLLEVSKAPPDLLTSIQRYLIDAYKEELVKDSIDEEIDDTLRDIQILPLPSLSNGVFISSSLISDVTIVGQDGLHQVILGIANISTRRILIAFDQHAVDERIRLEKILTSNEQAAFETPLDYSCQYHATHASLSCMLTSLEGYGFRSVLKNSYPNVEVSLASIPSFLVAQSHESILKLIRAIIADISSEQYAFQHIPTSLYNAMKSTACHGAVKFGDRLSLRQMGMMLEKLANCSFPFVCAHGRRLLAPLQWIE